MYYARETICPERRRRWRSRRTVLATTALLLAGIGVGACGNGPSSAGVAKLPRTRTNAAGSGGTGTKRTGLLAYAYCMRSHGVHDFPDPTASAGFDNKQAVVNALRQVTNAQAQSAQKACLYLLPGGSLSGQAAQPVNSADQRDYLKAAACMRAHGITDFPDPTFSGDRVSLVIPSGIDTSSKQFNQARVTCQKLIPRGLPYSASERGDG